MVFVLPAAAQPRCWHDVGGGVDRRLALDHRLKDAGDRRQIEPLPNDRTDRAFDFLPRSDAIEELEQQRPEEQLGRSLRPIWAILNFPDQILADPIGCPVCVGE